MSCHDLGDVFWSLYMVKPRGLELGQLRPLARHAASAGVIERSTPPAISKVRRGCRGV
jgi:hypothetical protein